MVHNRYENGLETTEQTGIMRTNCKDNLDRTNLVQTRFALKAAWKQLDLFIPNAQRTLNFAEVSAFEGLIRLSWADNGDALSLQYAGTCAMRSDHTRTGKTSLRGHWNDVLSAITRYYINNFEDGRNQDAIDLVIAKRPPIKSYKSDTKHFAKVNRISALLTQFFTILFKTFQPSRESRLGVFLCILWMTWVFFVWKIFRLDPNRIIDLPKLKTPKTNIPKESEQIGSSTYKIVKKMS